MTHHPKTKEVQKLNDYNRDNNENEGGEKKKKFKLFRNIYDKDGPGVDKDEIKAMEDPSLFNFFKLLKRKFGRLITVNALYLAGNFPFVFLIIMMSGYVMNEFSANAYSVFPSLYGVSLFEPESPAVASLMGIFGRVTTGYAHNTASIILLCLSLLIVFTFGCTNAGTTYILRNMVREEAVFLWSDFKYAIKRNWKQALPMGIIDSLLIVLLVRAIAFYNVNINAGGVAVPFLIISWAALLLYFFMRLYIYLMIVTFDLKLTKILKNAAFFAILGFKRNIMVLFGVVILAVLTLGLCIIFLPIGIIIPFTILFSLGGFMGTYAAYPKIKQIMIDPYYADHPDEKPEDYNE